MSSLAKEMTPVAKKAVAETSDTAIKTQHCLCDERIVTSDE